MVSADALALLEAEDADEAEAPMTDRNKSIHVKKFISWQIRFEVARIIDQ